ncbi:phage DNA ejection protein [Rosenbergiella nectarea]|uniref:phage DNA ejection protein n=1 Tax=Rosenbergiella nectarea TaxID=988801 RepID=UPI001BDA7DB4|nr:phage DNA ejection protein [Rosenbergiella nectarea]MBT0731018.1 phage DNA ejection protein [Rosenbergiella nectarea subsp. apis]
MPIQPIDYSSGNSGFLQGIQTAYDLKQAQQQNQAIEENNQFKQDWQNTNGDPEKMNALMMKYPGQMQTISQGIGYQNDNHRAALGAAAGDIWTAMQTGNPQAVAQAATKHASTLATVGSSPDEISSMLQNNPQQLGHLINTVRMTSLTPDQYATVQQNNAKLQQDGSIAGAKYQLDNQKFQYQQQQDNIQNGFDADRVGIERYKAQTGADLNALTLKLQSAYDNATTDNQRQQILQKQGQIQQAQKERYGGVANNIAAISSNLSQMRDLGSIVNNNPSIVSGTIGLGSQGAVGRYMPTISSASRDFESRRDQVLGSLLTDGSLKAIYGGNPSDGERKALAESVSTLKSATTPKAFNDELARLQQRSVNSAKRQIAALGIPRVQLPANQEAAAVSYLQNNPDQIGAFIQDHGYLPEGYWSTQAGK